MMLLLLSLVWLTSSLECLQGCFSCTTPYTCNNCSQPSCCSSTCLNCSLNTCLSCKPGYSLTTDTNICAMSSSCLQQACLSCANNFCSSCSPGFYLDEYLYECFSCGLNCMTCSSSSVCAECQNMYYLSQNQACLKCIQNCQNCTNQSNCVSCSDTFFYQDSQCQKCNAHCHSCADNTTCLDCFDGYYLNEGLCLRCTLPCLECQGSSDSCEKCLGGYNLINGNCMYCPDQIPNCLECGDGMTCLTCQDGYFLSSTAPASCIQCPAGCQICNASSCLVCFNLFFLNQTDNNCQACSNPQCLNCPNDTCIQCIQQTYLFQDACVSCSAGCFECFSYEICVQCFDSYYLRGGICQPCAHYCRTCSGGGWNCTSCISGFYQPDAVGVCIICPDYCPSCLSQSVCLSCSVQHYLSNGTCVKCSLQLCLECDTYFGSDVCVSCIPGYFYSNGTCTPCSQNCYSCPNETYCKTCISRYYSQSGSCVPCPNPNCQICIKLPVGGIICKQCLLGYSTYKTGNQTSALCSPCPDLCIGCSSPTFCTVCIQNFSPIPVNSTTTICSPCSYPCQTCSPLGTNICLQCVAGWRLNATYSCTQCEEGCSSCDQYSGCYTCLEGYTPKSLMYGKLYQCLKCPQNCLLCNVELVCLKCQKGFTYVESSNICFLCGRTNGTIGCQVCSSSGSCQTCSGNLVLNQQGVCSAPLPQTQSNDVIWIWILVLLSVVCAILIGILAWRIVKNRGEGAGLYDQIK